MKTEELKIPNSIPVEFKDKVAHLRQPKGDNRYDIYNALCGVKLKGVPYDNSGIICGTCRRLAGRE